jgi:hypothetical protein
VGGVIDGAVDDVVDGVGDGVFSFELLLLLSLGSGIFSLSASFEAVEASSTSVKSNL